MQPVLTAPEIGRATTVADQDGFDPLRYRTPLPLSGELYPLGFPVRIATNSPDVIGAASTVWAPYARLFDQPPIDVNVAVALDSTAPRPPATCPSGRGNLISSIHSSDNFVVADVSRGFAFGWLTPSVTTDHDYLRYHFLEPIVYLMLDCLHFTPVHAACVSLNNSGVLLCGDSGAGKTSLAYYLARRGWTYVSDDATRLLRCRDDSVIGRPYHIRFRDSARDLFPELRRWTPVQRPNGKFDLEIPTASLDLPSLAVETTPDYLVWLNREPGTRPQITPWNRDDAERRLERVLCFGEESTHREQQRALRRLTGAPLRVLRYSTFDEAELELRRLIDNRV